MSRILGVLLLLGTIYTCLFIADPKAMRWANLEDVANRQGFFGVLTLGVGVLIITGGIDLSIGSVVGLSAVGFGVLLTEGVPPVAALALVLLGGLVIGIFHGLLVTRLRLQSFLVTLCGLFIYRGIARQLSSRPVGLQQVKNDVPEQAAALDQLRYLLIGKDAEGALVFPAQLLLLMMLAMVVGILLHASIHGRYWYAIGANEQAARYAGIATERQRIAAFVLCSSLASLGGVLLFMDYGSATPETTGQWFELYAITGAVLGGCSLRGGEGTAVGIVLGAAVLPVLQNYVLFAGIPDAVIPSIIGGTLLLGTIVDEFFRGRGRRKRAG